MGYRNWFCRIPKDFDIERAADDWEYRYEITERLFELGKYVEFDFELNTIFDINKDGLRDDDGEWAVIEVDEITKFVDWYARKYVDFLKLCKTPIEELEDGERTRYELWPDQKPTVEKFIESELLYWQDAKNLVYNDDPNSPEIVKSWNYNYEIFEMLHLYKTFDRDNYYLVWYGG